MNKVVNPEMVLLARESRGVTQTQIAKSLGVTQAAISKAEKIPGKVSEVLLSNLSKNLDYPESFFYQPEHRYPPATPLKRKKQSLAKKIQHVVEAEANVRRLQIKHLLDSIELPETNIPSFDIDDFPSPEDIAGATRSLLRIPRGPIANLTNVIENLGIVIIPSDFRTDKLDGFTLIDGRDKPIIFFNHTMPWCRIRFTLAHEFGHIVMNHIQRPGIEEEANSFASSFLMPKGDIEKDFRMKRINIPELAVLKPYWKVSIQALLVRAHTLKYTNTNQNRRLWIAMGANGLRRREPPHLDISPEPPTLLKTMIDIHTTELDYTENELFDMLSTTKKTFFELYSFLQTKHPEKIKLRVVK